MTLNAKETQTSEENMFENELRAFNDEDAFTSPMDRDNYENEFSLLLLDEEETEEETQGEKLRYFSTCNAGAQWKNEWPIICRVFVNEST